MTFLEGRATSSDYSSIRLDAFVKNPRAVRFYERCEYRRAGQVRFRKGDFYCFEKETRMDARPFADPEYERFAASLFRFELTAEEFAARFGHEFALFNFHNFQYRTPRMTEWVDRLASFFFAPDLPTRLRAARAKYLTLDEIAAVEAYERDPL